MWDYFLIEQLVPLVLGSLGILTIGRVALAKQARRGSSRWADEALTNEVRALRERVQVLERAVVEPSHRLSREIDELRD